MKEVVHIFYVPGLGDPRYGGQGQLLELWRVYGIKVHYYPFYWSDDRKFSEKFQAFLKAIDDQVAQTGSISSIGASAGASAVLNAYAARQEVIDRVVCISGKINNPQTAANRFEQNPSFEDSLGMLAHSMTSLDKVARARILSLHPLYDGVVPISDTIIEGAHEGIEPILGHVASIAYALIFGSHRIAGFLKS